MCVLVFLSVHLDIHACKETKLCTHLYTAYLFTDADMIIYTYLKFNVHNDFMRVHCRACMRNMFVVLIV